VSNPVPIRGPRVHRDMPILPLVLLSASLLNVKPCPVFAEVTIGTAGPYRFVVDTGAQTSLIDAKLAAELGLKADHRVSIVTVNSERLRPAAKVNSLRVGRVELPATELVFDDFDRAGVRGLLGLNALAGLDFELLPKKGRLELGAARPLGEALPMRRVEDRIAVEARMGSETLTLILDSGATNLVLFRTPEAMAKTDSMAATFSTIEGMRKILPTTWSSDMVFGGLKVGMAPAAIVARPGTQADGLLPASLFKAVYVDRGRGEVVLVR
jgi:predicted aspartyl protease